MPDIRVCQPRELATVAAELIAGELSWLVSERTLARVALAGGSTPKATYEALAAPPHLEAVPWSDVFVYFGDERCVGADDKSSNYRMASESLLSKVPVPETNVFRIKGELGPDAATADYAETLGDASLDLVLLGMGGDGHTASLFPSAALDEQAKVVATRSPVPPRDRVSLGLESINAAFSVIFLIAGAAKADRVAEVYQQMKGEAPRLPAARVQPRSGRLIWLLDTDAAAKLENDA